MRLSSTREALAESQASLESSRTVDTDTELLNLPFLRQAGREADQLRPAQPFRRRGHLRADRVVACRAATPGMAKPNSGRSWSAAPLRPRFAWKTSAPARTSSSSASRRHRPGLSGVLRFAARLRKVLENLESAGPGVEVWTCIGVATLSEELRRSAEELRALAQKRAEQAQQNRSRRIILGACDGERRQCGTQAGRGFDGHQPRAGADSCRPGRRSGAAPA